MGIEIFLVYRMSENALVVLIYHRGFMTGENLLKRNITSLRGRQGKGMYDPPMLCCCKLVQM